MLDHEEKLYEGELAALRAEFKQEMKAKGPMCATGHPLEIVSEGYGLCTNPSTEEISVWAFSEPVGRWDKLSIVGRDGEPIPAWLKDQGFTREQALEIIRIDMGLRRALPFDEDVERARLMPV